MHAFPLHTHQSYLFGAILNGSATFVIDHTPALLQKGNTYLVPSNTGMGMDPVDAFSYLTICLRGKQADRLKQYHVSKYFPTTNADALLELTRKFLTKDLEEDGYVQGLVRLFGLMDSCQAITCNADMMTAGRYLQQHADVKFDLDALAKNMHVSKFHFIRSFQRQWGVTPKQYHQQCKVRFIRENIEQLTQSQAAYALGFATQSHMGAVFKKYMGITLKEYRDSLRRATS